MANGRTAFICCLFIFYRMVPFTFIFLLFFLFKEKNTLGLSHFLWYNDSVIMCKLMINEIDISGRSEIFED